MNQNQFREKLKSIIKDVYSQYKNKEKSSSDTFMEYDELTKFPELKKIITDLLTKDYDYFLQTIDWVSPKPTTFRINLKNGQNFYLIYSTRSWIAEIEGKRYYLLNLNEEESACEAISRLLRYGAKLEKEESEAGAEAEAEAETETENEPL